MDAARAFQEESGTDPGADLHGIAGRMEIRAAVQGGRIEDAIDRVNDLDPEVRARGARAAAAAAGRGRGALRSRSEHCSR